MTSDRPFQEQTTTIPSPSDLRQIKEAVRELRAASPRSVLADLVEDKIRAIEGWHPMTPLPLPAKQTRWISQ
ncbi:hypothetical protein FHR70_000506 [Microvirga lupini]|uniref:Uncharacterized protein n=1 Tax=Microvirga lupini TaxID=420324 RepID=A0A7W4YV35_9HYPH|nr:hypothetical protein [Microvirga lupini]MBB3017466.1 hypothetical protein [Microvirga lupini]